MMGERTSGRLKHVIVVKDQELKAAKIRPFL